VANGTIAFDTLTTSDSVKSGTEKSINTSYLYNGVNKFWINMDGQSTISTRDSLNISGVTDVGEGQYTPAYTNVMGNANYSIGNNTDYDGVEFPINCKNLATNQHSIQTVDVDLSSYHDHDIVMVHGMGDLA